jgi:hypothetical protein
VTPASFIRLTSHIRKEQSFAFPALHVIEIDSGVNTEPSDTDVGAVARSGSVRTNTDVGKVEGCVCALLQTKLTLKRYCVFEASKIAVQLGVHLSLLSTQPFGASQLVSSVDAVTAYFKKSQSFIEPGVQITVILSGLPSTAYPEIDWIADA